MGQKDCFGILDTVFPMSESGLREIKTGCFQCPDRTPCLRAALDTVEGLQMRSDFLERAQQQGGLFGRLKRWSEKKEIARLMKQKKQEKR
ncbi:MAG: hypothetical protein ABIG67_00845 [Pseudomonadota bacterium]